MEAETAASTASPARWPWVSLTALKWSMSAMATASGVCTPARTDAKTGLLNAGAWQREAAVEVTRARAQSPLALAIADIDHFKAVNDTHGHLAGDAVLAAVSAAMRDLLRDCDLCGRFGGEEFALLLPRTTAAQALEITERIRQGISQLAIPRDGTSAIRVTISVGVAVPSQARRTLDDLLAAADHALYQAKGWGRDRVVMYADTRVPQVSRPLPLARTNVLGLVVRPRERAGPCWKPGVQRQARPAPRFSNSRVGTSRRR